MSAEEIEAQLDPSRMPRHVGIIMDGNGRWARRQGFMERIRGHEAGIDSVREITRACGELGLQALSLYAFSKENWSRPQREIDALMALLERFLYNEVDELNSNNVRLTACGAIQDLPAGCQKALAHTMQATAGNTGMILNLALSYGGRYEIVEAVRKIAREIAVGALKPDEIDEDTLSRNMYRPELGDPDLIIRTSDEFRVSNFMIWQSAYSEFHITPVLWPEFRKIHLLAALLDYQRRDRRFGGV
ncbi:isoprenyl transferase [Candidatus Sumerlaeota bacterium]|nr:isoprenyl transferase [Candidatus Sumerlaeota bacterium]